MTPPIDGKTAQDIERRITRIHRDIGYRDGAVNLADVRNALKLDLRYYTADSTDILDEMAHRLRLGVKRIAQDPAVLLEVIRKFDLRALYLPNKRRILIDHTIHHLKKRWSEGHEIAHSVLPWHQEFMFGDDKHTLSPAHHEEIESEANFGCAKLLFPSAHFSAMAADSRPNFKEIGRLASYFGNTITTTLWRYAENARIPAFALISQHPHHPKVGEQIVDAFVRSPRFILEFPTITAGEVFTQLCTYGATRKNGPLGSREIILMDTNGQAHIFLFESFSNRYSVLTIGSYIRSVTFAF